MPNIAQQANDAQRRRCCLKNGLLQSTAESSEQANPNPPMATVKYKARWGRSNLWQKKRLKTSMGQLMRLATNREQGLRKKRMKAGDLDFCLASVCWRLNHLVSGSPISYPNSFSLTAFIRPLTPVFLAGHVPPGAGGHSSDRFKANRFCKKAHLSQSGTAMSRFSDG